MFCLRYYGAMACGKRGDALQGLKPPHHLCVVTKPIFVIIIVIIIILIIIVVIADTILIIKLIIKTIVVINGCFFTTTFNMFFTLHLVKMKKDTHMMKAKSNITDQLQEKITQLQVKDC